MSNVDTFWKKDFFPENSFVHYEFTKEWEISIKLRTTVFFVLFA